MTELSSALDAYTALERKIDKAWRAMAPVCAACETPCCRPDICRESVESDWARLVSTREYGEWMAQGAREAHGGEGAASGGAESGPGPAGVAGCVALRTDGCLLEVGRPAVCRGYYCDAVLDACEDVFQVVFYAFTAELPWGVGRLGRRGHLMSLGEDELEALAPRILANVRRADALFELSRGLLEEDVGEAEKLRIVLALVCAEGAFLKQGARARILRALSERGLALPDA